MSANSHFARVISSSSASFDYHRVELRAIAMRGPKAPFRAPGILRDEDTASGGTIGRDAARHSPTSP